MKKMLFPFISSLLFSLFIIPHSIGQDEMLGKHPRVIEMEMMLNNEAANFFQRRFPNEPFSVNTEVIPLRRLKSSASGERLPYYTSDEEIIDEWDSPEFTLENLFSRIKQVNLKVDVPHHFSDEQIQDVKDRLIPFLKLIPGRDVIAVERKDIGTISKDKSSTLWYVLAASLFILASFYMMLTFFSKSFKAHQDQKTQTNNGANSSIPSAPSVSMPTPSSSNDQMQKSSLQGDINFRDPTKTLEIIQNKIKDLTGHGHFPNLLDMVCLEELAEKSSSHFGALIYEFPAEYQEKIFSRGRMQSWYKGYTQPSSINNDCLSCLDQMARRRQTSGNHQWEELLIQVWRLKHEAVRFLKQIPQEDAFAILFKLPKNFSVPVAKKAFPGAWAKILGNKETEAIKDDIKIKNYINIASQINPYFDYKSVDRFRKDLELIAFLRTASLKDEEEIYESVDEQSIVHQLRPPFYKIFKNSSDSIKMMIDHFSLDQWALALLNAPREYIREVFNNLDDKKKFLFSAYLKQFDERVPHPEAQGEIKEKIAAHFESLMKIKENQKKNKDNNQQSDQDDEKVEIKKAA